MVLVTGQPASIVPETVVVPSGKLRLKAYLWKPTGPGPFPTVLFNHGSGGADAGHTAGLPMTEAAEKLAPLFLKHGYAFLYLFRRGQGLSADQGPFMLTLLAAERDNTLRAAVTFAAAAGSWQRSAELRQRLEAAVEKTTAPIMLIQAANDYSTAPSKDLADELRRLHKSFGLKIYPPVGQRSDEGHNFLYLGIPQWEYDVFGFLDEHLKR